jgi:hypothetical protein
MADRAFRIALEDRAGNAGRMRIRRRSAGPFRAKSADRRLLLAAGVLAIGLLLPLATPGRVGAASVTATVSTLPQILSVTVSTDRLTYANCTGGTSTTVTLGFPNGRCTAGPITIQNGGVTAFVSAFGTGAVPSDGGTPWLLCDGLQVDCTGNDPSTPGQNEFLESTSNVTDPNAQEFPIPAQVAGCDFAFGCQVPPGFSATELLHITGPAATTDPSPQFTSTITWTAAQFGL